MDWQNIHRSKAYNECMSYFDTFDDRTRTILLSVNEADQQLVMQGLANKLYSYIVTKVNGIDYGTIPLSKGNIQKIEKYDQLIDCIGVLTQILINYKQPIDQIDVINTAIKNVTDRTKLFTEAYKLNIEMPIIIYNTIVLSIVSTVSLLISAHVEFIKMGDDSGYEIAFYKTSKFKSREKLLFRTLKDFNNACASGEFDKTMQYTMKTALSKKEAAHVVEEGYKYNYKMIPIEPIELKDGEAILKVTTSTKMPFKGKYVVNPNTLSIGDTVHTPTNNFYMVTDVITNGDNIVVKFKSVSNPYTAFLTYEQSTDINLSDYRYINEDLATGAMAAASYSGESIAAAGSSFLGNIGAWIGSHPVLVGIGAAILGIIVIIKLIRWAIYYFYRERTTYAEKCDTMSTMLYMNAMNYQNNLTVDPKQRKEVAEKQGRLAKFFKKVADILRVNDNKAEVQATQDIVNEDRNKLKYSDISNVVPKSAQDSLF